MAKVKQWFAIFLSVCMLMTTIPVSGIVNAAEPATLQEENFVCDLGSENPDHIIFIENDSTAKIKFEVSYQSQNGSIDISKKQVVVDPGSKGKIKVNQGDTYSVKKIGNEYYDITNEQAFLIIGEETVHQIGNTFTNTYGEDISFDNYYYEKPEGAPFDGSITDIVEKTIGGLKKTIVNSSYHYGKISIALSDTAATVTCKVDDQITDTSVVPGITKKDGSDVLNDHKKQLKNAAKALFEKILTDHDLCEQEHLFTTDITIEGTAYTPATTSGCGSSEKEATYSVKNNTPLESYVSVINQPDIFEFVDSDITLKYSGEPTAKTGAFNVNVLNQERLNQMDTAINAELFTNIKALTDDSATDLSSVDDIVKILTDEGSIGQLMSLMAMDNMPSDYTVTLKEKDLQNGLCEGLTYTFSPSEHQHMFFDLDLREILENTYNNLSSAQKTIILLAVAFSDYSDPIEYILSKIGEPYSAVFDCNIRIPISLGEAFAKSDIRAGKYTLEITSPGEGWVLDDQISFDVEINQNQTASVGKTHNHGSVEMANIVAELAGSDLIGTLLGDAKATLYYQNGVEFKHILNAVEFTNTELSQDSNNNILETAIDGAEFLMVDKNRFIEMTDALISLGKETVDSVAGGITYDDLLNLSGILSSSEENTELEQDIVDRVLVTVIALDDQLSGFNIPAILEATGGAKGESGVVTFTPDNNVTFKKLCELIPEIYNQLNESEDEKPAETTKVPEQNLAEAPVLTKASVPEVQTAVNEPAVRENKDDSEKPEDNSNRDLDSVLAVLSVVGDKENIQAIKDFIEDINQLKAILDEDSGDTPGGDNPGGDNPGGDNPGGDNPGGETPSDPGESTLTTALVMDILTKIGDCDAGYAAFNLLGLSEGKFPTGDYILIQKSAPENIQRNPMIYVFKNQWLAADNIYETHASIDLFDLMSNEQYAAFVEKLASSGSALNSSLGEAAKTADQGLELLRELLGEDSHYDVNALAKKWEELKTSTEAQNEASGITASQNEATPVKDAIAESEPSDQASQEKEAFKEKVNTLLSEMMDIYIPQEMVIAYLADRLYESSDGLFANKEEATAVVVQMLKDKDVTFENLLKNINQLADKTNNVFTGKITKDWHYYNFKGNAVDRFEIVFHSVLTQVVPSELVPIIERKLYGDIEAVEQLVEILYDQISTGEKITTEETANDDALNTQETDEQKVDSPQQEETSQNQTSSPSSSAQKNNDELINTLKKWFNFK